MDTINSNQNRNNYGLYSRIHIVVRGMHRQFQRIPSVLGSSWRLKRLLFLLFLLLFAASYLLLDWQAMYIHVPAPQPPPLNGSKDTRETIDPRRLGLNNMTPTKKFRDNLRSDSFYITSWSSAGFTNQFMGYVNMIYLSTLTDRIPIIPPFAPDHHISSYAGILPFGDIFDLDVLREHLRIPVIEWRDVKDLTPESVDDPWSVAEVEDIGCWTTRKESAPEPVRAENVVDHLGLDVSYTRLPTYTRLQPNNREDDHVVLPQLASVTYPRRPRVDPKKMKAFVPSPVGHYLTPDHHLTCFDTLYYVTSGSMSFEWQYTWSPAWRTIGRHLPFTQKMKNLGREYLLRMFDSESLEDDLPPFIAVHIRRGDFVQYCPKVDGHLQDCLPDPLTFKKHVEGVQQDLLTERRLSVSKVVVMSDEISSLFWAKVDDQGWYHVNHTKENTLDLHGEWYLPLIETVMQSYAVGFVGTEGSTYSLVSQRRVEDWNHGITKNFPR